jgi:sulfate permease, SulP family
VAVGESRMRESGACVQGARRGADSGPRATGPRDVIAGVSVALVLIPQSLAYAEVAGMPAYRGLYAAVLPPIAAAFIASSPYLQKGHVAITSLLTFGALASLAEPGSSEYVQLGLLLAVVVGAFRVLLGVTRAGVIAYLMSQPMLMGFVPAAAILIAASQLPSVLGAPPPGGGILEGAASTLTEPALWEATAIVLSLFVVLLVLGGRRIHPVFPGVLVAVGLAILYSLAADYGGPKVGSLPGGLPPLSLALPWGDLPSLLVPGAVIALVGFAEPASIARAFAAEDRAAWNADRELVSQGVANLAAGLTGGFPVGGSFSRSSLNRLAGARTRWSGAVTGLTVLAFLPFAAALEPLPRAVLGAIVVVAVAGLLRLGPALRLWSYSKPQFAVAWVTFAATLAFAPHVERALMVGIGLSIAVHLWRELSLKLETWIDGETLHVKPLGVLWFATASDLQISVLRLLAGRRDLSRLQIHLDGLGRLDITGALTLQTVLEDASRAGLDAVVVDVPPAAERLVARVLQKPGIRVEA